MSGYSVEIGDILRDRDGRFARVTNIVPMPFGWESRVYARKSNGDGMMAVMNTAKEMLVVELKDLQDEGRS